MGVTLADLLPQAVDLELKHPVTLDPLGVSLKVVGPDSSQFRTATTVLMKRRLTGDALSPEEVLDHNCKLLASLVTGWSSDEFFGGAYSATAVEAIFSNPGYGWVREQVEAFTQDRTNFFRAGS
jgi:hypothetical protein